MSWNYSVVAERNRVKQFGPQHTYLLYCVPKPLSPWCQASRKRSLTSFIFHSSLSSDITLDACQESHMAGHMDSRLSCFCICPAGHAVLEDLSHGHWMPPFFPFLLWDVLAGRAREDSSPRGFLPLSSSLPPAFPFPFPFSSLLVLCQ